MAELNGLPVYEITFKEDISAKSGIDFISLVDYPAIESNWVAMSKGEIPIKFNFNSEKQLLTGPILIPDQAIYRNDPNGIGEYYVVFKADTIEKLVRKFQATQKSINLNYQHLKDSQVKDAVVQEIWLSGENDKSKDLGFDHPKGTAFICSHIGDKKFWDDEVKSGNVKGYSIEGFLDLEMKKLIQQKMSSQKFAAYTLADGNGDIFIDGEIAVDNYVFSNYPSVTLVNGVKQITQYPCWQETLVLADGTILTLKDSKILKIEKKQGMSAKFVTAKTDTGVEITTDSDTIDVGVDVYTMDNGTKTPLPTGTYTLDNGYTIDVTDGKVTAIQEGMTEEEIAVIQKAMSKVIAELKAEIAELKTKLSAIPAAPSATSAIPTPNTAVILKMSAKQKVYTKLADIRAKSKNLTETEK